MLAAGVAGGGVDARVTVAGGAVGLVLGARSRGPLVGVVELALAPALTFESTGKQLPANGGRWRGEASVTTETWCGDAALACGVCQPTYRYGIHLRQRSRRRSSMDDIVIIVDVRR